MCTKKSRKLIDNASIDLNELLFKWIEKHGEKLTKEEIFISMSLVLSRFFIVLKDKNPNDYVREFEDYLLAGLICHGVEPYREPFKFRPYENTKSSSS